jgi:hypothetical protein
MPIRIVARANASCPVVFCDHCQREIKTAKEGSYQYQFMSEGASDAFFTHWDCHDAFRKAHPEINNDIELTLFSLYLSNNLEIDPKEAQRSAERGAQL